MSEIKHTPGPWFVDDMGGTPVVREARTDEAICRIEQWSKQVEEADARLIAAAPDLLAALKEQVGECPDPGCTMCFEHKAIIAKAEGQDNGKA